MWIVAIAWMYVTVMMAMAEATSPQGTVLGALITLVFYGLGPMALVMYVLRTPMRRKARLAREAREAREAQEAQAQAPAPSDGGPSDIPSADADGSADPDRGSLPAGDPVPPERKEP